MINNKYKNWEISNDMFGKNTKKECKLINSLIKKHIILPLTDKYSIIKIEEDDCGWIINNKFLN